MVTYEDRVTRTGLTFVETFFKRCDTEIVVINDYTNEQTDGEELIEELITLLRAFSMTFYSNSRQLKKRLMETPLRD